MHSWEGLLLLCICTCGALWQAAGQSPGIQLITGDASSPSPSASSQIRINEVVLDNGGIFVDVKGDTPAWLELYNEGPSDLELQGYTLSVTKSSGKESSWSIPEGVSIVSRGFLLILADGDDAVTNGEIHAGIKLTDAARTLTLSSTSGSQLSSLNLPILSTNQSFGVAADMVQAADGPSAALSSAILATPTPGYANSDAASIGPVVALVTENPDPRPSGGVQIPISAYVSYQAASVASVTLTYQAGYDAAVSIAMDPASSGSDTYTASIPASAAPVGGLIRWYVSAEDEAGRITEVPAADKDGKPQYYGTIVADSSDSSTLPILELYSEDSNAPFSTGPESNAIGVTGGKGDVLGCSMWFNGTFYDGISIRRRGSTSIGWPKPKIKIKSKSGKVFKINGLSYDVSSFGLNSNWFEPGANTFTREPLVWATFKEMGVESLESFHVHVRFNGAYFGRFSLQEEWSKDALKRVGYSTSGSNYGSFWKANSGINTNLVYGVSTTDLPVVYGLESPSSGQDASVTALQAFTQGLAGGGSVPRSSYIFDAVNLPQVINYLAAQTLILNQDRCTKNFMVYLDGQTGQWSMLPWDVESGYGIDRGLGGEPAPDYCTLACEQWNSPLYCDRNHTQDLVISTPYGRISQPVTLGATSGFPQARRRQLLSSLDIALGTPRTLRGLRRGRRLAQDLFQDTTESGAGQDLADDYDANLSTGTPPSGAIGSYNYLADAVLSLPRTRAMYMRRLRTLMDEFTAGRLEALATSFHSLIREEAIRDNKFWGNTGDPDRGYQQIITEQLPIRKQQLYDTYGPGGTHPFIPDSQSSSASLDIGQGHTDAGSWLQLTNSGSEAVDVSGWSLTGDVEFTFRPGTTVAAGDTIVVAADLVQYKSSYGGSGSYVVGPMDAALTSTSPSVQLVKA